MVSGEERIERSGSKTTAQGWNELGFVPWRSFRKMAPSILNLEVTRIAGLIGQTEHVEYRNALVKARYELSEFVEALGGFQGAPEHLPLTHLEAAIVNLPMEYPGIDPNAAETLAYILDRLQYVHNRIRFVYQ